MKTEMSLEAKQFLGGVVRLGIVDFKAEMEGVEDYTSQMAAAESAQANLTTLQSSFPREGDAFSERRRMVENSEAYKGAKRIRHRLHEEWFRIREKRSQDQTDR